MGRSKKPTSIYAHLSTGHVDIAIGGLRRKVSREASLRWRTLEEAFQGRVAAVKEVFGWIDEREAERARRLNQGSHTRIYNNWPNPVGMDDALLALGVAHERVELTKPDQRYLELLPWAVQLALDRKNAPDMRDRDLRDLRAQTHDASSLRWPGRG